MTIFTFDRVRVNHHDKQFFVALGSRLASVRKAQGLTQQLLRKMLDGVLAQAQSGH